MRQLKLTGVCALQQFWHAAQVFQCSAPDVVCLDSTGLVHSITAGGLCYMHVHLVSGKQH